MPILDVILILLAGTAAGFLNTLAGGGSLITMPILIFMGLPSATANGTNRIALAVQNIVAVTNFRSKGFFDWRMGLMLAAPAVVGSIVGANLAVSLPDRIFNKILAVVMLLVLALILWQPLKKLSAITENLTNKRKVIAVITFFFVGVYGGFIQAGVGFIIIASLTTITGMSLVRINSIKVFVVLFYILSSLIIFIVNGQVDWLLGLTLAAGNALGAWIGSTFAVSKGDKLVRIVLSIAVTLMAAKLLGVFELLGLGL